MCSIIFDICDRAKLAPFLQRGLFEVKQMELYFIKFERGRYADAHLTSISPFKISLTKETLNDDEETIAIILNQQRCK